MDGARDHFNRSYWPTGVTQKSQDSQQYMYVGFCCTSSAVVIMLHLVDLPILFRVAVLALMKTLQIRLAQ